MSERYNLSDPEEAEKGIAAAVTALRAGDLVVLPTDTVYGVAADAFDQTAVNRLQEVKDRGRESPPPVLVGTVAAMDGLADEIDDNSRELVAKFWPGGLSLVLTQQPSLTWDLGDNNGTVMLRMPERDEALQILRRTGPLAVSSANKHGRPPATSVEVAEAELGDEVAVYLDGGETPGPLPSTIVDMTRVVPQLLRRGVISEEQLREVLSLLEVDIDGEALFPELEADSSQPSDDDDEAAAGEDDDDERDDDERDDEAAVGEDDDDERDDDERDDEAAVGEDDERDDEAAAGEDDDERDDGDDQRDADGVGPAEPAEQPAHAAADDASPTLDPEERRRSDATGD